MKPLTQKGQLKWREALQIEAQQSRPRGQVLAVVTVISKAFVTVGAAGARVGCMWETEAEGRTDGVETETMKLINKWSEHDLSTRPLGSMLEKNTRGDDDLIQPIT